MSTKSVLLVSYAVQSKGPVPSGLMLDNGVALMASHLINAGFSPTIFDYNNLHTVRRVAEVGKEQFVKQTIEGLTDHISRTAAKLIGFKLYMNGFKDSVLIAAELRRRFGDGLKIIGGGPQVEWFGDAVYDFAQKAHGNKVFDALVYGDADVAIVGLAKAAYGTEPAEIPNLILRNGKTIKTARRYQDINLLPHPTYDPAVYRDIGGKIFIPVIEDSRGCGNACTFCVHPRIGGMRREKNIENLLTELEALRKKFGTKIFRLAGPKPTARYVNELVRNLPSDVRFSAFGYADQNYDFEAVAKHLIGLFCGLESTDRTILERTYRKTRSTDAYLENARNMIMEFGQRGLATITSLIVPSPDESSYTMKRTLDFLVEVQPDFAPVLPIAPMPGTPLTRVAGRDPDSVGMMLEDDYAHRLMLYELDLLQPPQNWPKPPWKVRVNGKFVENPFAEVTAGFVQELGKYGIQMLSDEQVLMAYLYHGGLSIDQTERRRQCVEVNNKLRQAITEGNAASFKEIVERINGNNSSTLLQS